MKKSMNPPSLLSRVVVILLLIYGISLAHAKDWVYEVQKGDNLWDITLNYLIDSSYLNRLQQLNNITNPQHLKPGSKIRIPDEWIRRSPAQLQVQNLQGTAQVLEESSGELKTIQSGAIVMQGETVITGVGSTLSLLFLDGSRILLLEKSRLKINHLMSFDYTGMSDSQLQLEEGRLETQVVPNKDKFRQFEIKTPATVTSVRGTDYRLSAESEKNESRTEVVEGKVDVKGVKIIRSLNTGFGTLTIKNQEPLPPVKLLPEPDISQLPDVFVQVPIQFFMPALKDGQRYRVQIAKTPLFNNILFNKLINSAYIKGPDLPDGDYHIRIRGVDNLQLEGLNAQREFKINARPEVVVGVSPEAGEGILVDESVKFRWSKQNKVSFYHVQVAKDQSFSNILVEKESRGEELTIEETMDVGKYFWRVAAADQEGEGPFSKGRMFRRIKRPPILESFDITENSLIIRLQSGLPSQKYHIQIAEDEVFNKILVDKHSDAPQVEIKKLRGGTYYMRASTIDSDGYIGSFSKPQSINVPRNFYWLSLLLPLLVYFALK